MSSTHVVPMVAPDHETHCTADGSPYRAGIGNLVHAREAHVAELLERGFHAVNGWSTTGTAPLSTETASALLPADERAAPIAKKPTRSRAAKR